MKKLITLCTLFVAILGICFQAQAQNVFTKGTALPYNTSAIVTLNKNGPYPIANISFRVGNITIGNVTLSPMQPSARNLNYMAAKQSLSINSITYTPGSPVMQDQIFIMGSASDASGSNRASFSVPLL